jgi:hypothetical protein
MKRTIGSLRLARLIVLTLIALVPAARAHAQAPCCSITAINAQTATVSAKVNATGATFQFKVANAKMLSGVKVGQGVYANLNTKQVSLDGRSACCTIATTSLTGPLVGAGGTRQGTTPPATDPNNTGPGTAPVDPNNTGPGTAPASTGATAGTGTHSTAGTRPATPTGTIVPTVLVLSTSVCLTSDGKNCLSPNAPRSPAGQAHQAIVIVTSVGQPVGGAAINVAGQRGGALTNASGVAIVNYNGCVSSARSPQGVPVAAVPAPCQAAASKSGYQSAVISLP